MNKLYIVSLGAQQKEIDKYRFKECGKIIVGAVEIWCGTFLPCRNTDCKFEEKSQGLGIFTVAGKKERVIMRKLIK